jgi:hypothetical protein
MNRSVLRRVERLAAAQPQRVGKWHRIIDREGEDPEPRMAALIASGTPRSATPSSSSNLSARSACGNKAAGSLVWGSGKPRAIVKGHKMSVYVDEAIWAWQGLRWAHLVADDLDELHRFAHRLGIHRTSFQAPPKSSSPHYDITAFERRRALGCGAIPCGRAEIVAVARRHRGRNRITTAEQAGSSPTRDCQAG